jgi:hypothetical protein
MKNTVRANTEEEIPIVIYKIVVSPYLYRQSSFIAIPTLAPGPNGFCDEVKVSFPQGFCYFLSSTDVKSYSFVCLNRGLF